MNTNIPASTEADSPPEYERHVEDFSEDLKENDAALPTESDLNQTERDIGITEKSSMKASVEETAIACLLDNCCLNFRNTACAIQLERLKNTVVEELGLMGATETRKEFLQKVMDSIEVIQSLRKFLQEVTEPRINHN